MRCFCIAIPPQTLEWNASHTSSYYSVYFSYWPLVMLMCWCFITLYSRWWFIHNVRISNLSINLQKMDMNELFYWIILFHHYDYYHLLSEDLLADDWAVDKPCKIEKNRPMRSWQHDGTMGSLIKQYLHSCSFSVIPINVSLPATTGCIKEILPLIKLPLWHSFLIF